jgi:hypothetical protein
VMSKDDDWDEICDWYERRKAQILDAWGKAFHETIGGSPWTTEVELRLDDAADKQARAERFAYLYGKPTPNIDAALAELIAWIRHGELSEKRDPAGLPALRPNF